MWICTRKHGPAPQESTLPLAKASLAAFPGVALQSAEVSQLWYLGVPGVAPRVLYTAAGGTHVLALLVAVMFAAEQHWHPCPFWNVPLACAATRNHFWGCGPACFLPSFTAYPACTQNCGFLQSNRQQLFPKWQNSQNWTEHLQEAKTITKSIHSFILHATFRRPRFMNTSYNRICWNETWIWQRIDE